MAVNTPPPNRASYPNEQAYLQAMQAWRQQQQAATPPGTIRATSSDVTGGAPPTTTPPATTPPATTPPPTTPPPVTTTPPPVVTPPPTTTQPPPSLFGTRLSQAAGSPEDIAYNQEFSRLREEAARKALDPFNQMVTGSWKQVTGIDPKHPPPRIADFPNEEAWQMARRRWTNAERERIRNQAYAGVTAPTRPPPTVAPPDTSQPPEVTPPGGGGGGAGGGGGTTEGGGDTTTTEPPFQLDQDIRNRILGGYETILGDVQGGADRAYDASAGRLRERLSQQSQAARDRMVNEMVGRGIGASPALMGEQALGGINRAESQAYSEGLTGLEEERSARQQNALNRLNEGMSNILGLSGQDVDLKKFAAQFGLDEQRAAQLWKQLELDRWKYGNDAEQQEKNRQMQERIARMSQGGSSMDDIMKMLQIALGGG